MSGCEALVRWRHPERGLVPPSEFIPLAEEAGLIVRLSAWIVHTACQTAAGWPEHIRVSINVSAVQFRDPDRLVEMVAGALAAAALPADRLELEVTETAMLENNAATGVALNLLKALGVSIAMDDFGTGYSSLRSLQSFRFDRLKIDRSFVAAIETDAASITIIKATTSLAKGLGMLTTAEGIETRAQLALVEAEGCSEVQGYLLSKPVTEAEINRLVQHTGPWSMLAPSAAA